MNIIRQAIIQWSKAIRKLKQGVRPAIQGLSLGVICLLVLGGGYLGVALPVLAQEGDSAANEADDPLERPFQLPFAAAPGPDTWLMAQPYGNTTGAYRQRFTTYGASGGIHFGVDLSAPCGTEILAVADGLVFAVDGPFGSPPHNLMIDHPQLGYASMYGHLQEAPTLKVGERVKQGQVVALSGDSRETCYGRPHLHLEIRDLNHIRKYNPTTLIEANWDNLILIGDTPRQFARDLSEPRKWQSLYDQPQARTAGPIINDFAYPWPFDWENGSTLPPVSATLQPLSQSTVTLTMPLRSILRGQGQQLTQGNCCTLAQWANNGQTIRFIDQPTADSALGIWMVDVEQPETGPYLSADPLALYSPNGRLMAYPDPDSGFVVVERKRDGRQWLIDTEGERPNFAPNSRAILWTTSEENVPRDNRQETTWMADVDGDNQRIIWQARRTDAVGWLSNHELLMRRRIGGTADQQLFALSLRDGSERMLIKRLPQFRGTAFSPNKRYLVYYVALEKQARKNGVWLLDLEQSPLTPQKLPFFGSYRWRDNQHLIYIPFAAEATSHDFYEYDISSQQVRPLFPEGTGLTITNHEWQVSPNGRQISLLAVDEGRLDGMWLLDIE